MPLEILFLEIEYEKIPLALTFSLCLSPFVRIALLNTSLSFGLLSCPVESPNDPRSDSSLSDDASSTDPIDTKLFQTAGKDLSGVARSISRKDFQNPVMSSGADPFIRTADGEEDWIIYHAAKQKD